MSRMRLEDFDEATRVRIVAAMENGNGAKNAPRARKCVDIGTDGCNALKSQSGANPTAKKSFCDEKPPRMNKTETAFYGKLLDIYKKELIFIQPTRFFKLEGGGTYTPDFLVFSLCGVYVYECKLEGAHYPGWEQGVERFKRAAAQFDGDIFWFVMAIRQRNGVFDYKDWRNI